MTTSQPAQAFKMDDKIRWVAPAMFFMSGILPAMSIFELLTTGTIDMNAVARGRIGLPIWILYLIAWPCFLFFWAPFAWWVRHLVQGHVFKIDDERLVVGGRSVSLDAIYELRTYWCGNKVALRDGKHFWFAPGFNSKGCELLYAKLPDRWW